MSTSLDFLVSFQWALKTCRLYGPSHVRNTEGVTALQGVYQRFLKDKPQIQIAARNGKMFVDKVIEDSHNLQIKALAGEFEEHGIHALLLYPGASLEELQALISLLCLKPSQLRAQGGAKKLLEEKGVTRIRILAVRIEDVSEGGEIPAALLESLGGLAGAMSKAGVKSQASGGGASTKPDDLAAANLWALAGLWSHGAASAKPDDSAAVPVAFPPAPSVGGQPGGAGAQGHDFNNLVGQMRGFLLSRIAGSQGSPDLSGLGGHLQSLGMDKQGVQPGTQGAVRQALASLAPEQQLELFRGAAQLHTGPLRNLFGRLSNTMAAPSFAAAFARGSISEEKIAEIAEQLKPLSPNPEGWGEQLVDALRREGMTEGQLRDLVDIMAWESQPSGIKLAKLLEGQRIFEMPVEKVLAFMRELLEAGRNEEFLRVLRHYSSGLAVPAVARRAAVASAFEKIAEWVDVPGMSPPLMDELMELLARAFGREKDPEVHQSISRAVEHLLWFWVESGNPARTYELFSELQDVVTELSLPAPWKAQATANLLVRLGSPDRVNKVLIQLFNTDHEDASARIHPYLRMLGPTAAHYLVERLTDEPDRGRRSHLLDALRACGHGAEAPLLESLKSKEWFVLRNAVIVLGEVSGPERVQDLLPLLHHPDARVAGATIRAVGRLGGKSAESSLIPLLGHKDPGIQTEVLFILNEMKTKQAVPALIDLVRKEARGKHKSEQERVRERALEVLGHVGALSAIPVLVELLARRRNFFLDSREPLPIRVAALKALLSMDTRESQEAVHGVLNKEPKGSEKETLEAALTEALSGRPSRS
jgi:HEAT repeat protein